MRHTLFPIKQLALSAIATLWLASCTVEVPSHVIQPEKMENLLYDYHLMQAMAGDLSSSESYKRKQYEQYVFDKYHVNEAEFDTSLTWYLRHTKELEDIYKKLNKRLTAKKDELAAHIPPYERIDQDSPEGDTVDVWNDFRLMRLTVSPSTNKLTFILTPDSNYHMRDSIEWSMNARFLGDTAYTRAAMGLTLMYENDTIGTSCIINQSGPYSLALANDSNYQIKEIYGQVYYYNRNKETSATSTSNDSLPEFSVLPVADLLLSDISIMRYHRPEVVEADTTSTSSDETAEPKDSIQSSQE